MQLMEKRDGRIIALPADGVFEKHYDVIVVGLGTAGSMAAIAAARKGLSVLGIERLNCMGGTGTVGGVVGYYYGNRGGIFEDIDSQVAAYQRQDDFAPFQGVHAEIKNWIMDTQAVKAGTEVSYESFVIGVYRDEHKVRGLCWVSPAGIHRTSASVVIDSTGNAEVCELAGCALDMGRELDGECQPFSNVQMKLYPNGAVGNFYTDSGYIHVADPDSVTQAIIDSNLLGTHLQETFTGEALLLKTAALLGIRESRRIVGEERVTFADVLEDRLTAEPVFFGFSNLDNHGKDMAFESENQQDWLVAASLFGPNMNVPVPMGALIPQGFDGLLAAGRCISLDHDIASAIRQKRDMEKSGEVAANIAYLAIRDHVHVKEVPYAKLKELLVETKCLKVGQTLEFQEITPQEDHERKPIPASKWLTDPQAIKEGLSGDKPGIAIWSAKRLGGSIIASLKEWTDQHDEPLLRKNSALALGLMGESASLPVLREIVYSRDLYLPRTSRKYNQPHLFAAIYLLGRLKDLEIMPELMRFMRNETFMETLEADSSNDEFIFDRTELYFQFFSFSMMAALRIADQYEEWRPQIDEVVTGRFSDPNFELIITLKTHIKEANGFLKNKMNERVHRIYSAYTSRWN
ncbi:hypothetical protein SY83_04550 [Paenibacillus swuensis]|uniref:FAD-dependent oxidoreductase n=2 Tax=Paenibacillus swuensis TaxID=1178515 RepID=A0A172TF58_9BACL|nr:hypothetical protein SY83_04550 [Paenibacillus swuensis]